MSLLRILRVVRFPCFQCLVGTFFYWWSFGVKNTQCGETVTVKGEPYIVCGVTYRYQLKRGKYEPCQSRLDVLSSGRYLVNLYLENLLENSWKLFYIKSTRVGLCRRHSFTSIWNFTYRPPICFSSRMCKPSLFNMANVMERLVYIVLFLPSLMLPQGWKLSPISYKLTNKKPCQQFLCIWSVNKTNKKCFWVQVVLYNWPQNNNQLIGMRACEDIWVPFLKCFF